MTNIQVVSGVLAQNANLYGSHGNVQILVSFGNLIEMLGMLTIALISSNAVPAVEWISTL